MRLTEKYRPQTFEEIIGQEKCTDTLKALIAHDGKLPTAILLVGKSGIGKTTIARVCANVMNSKPIELNCSERTSVDDIRELLDLVLYSPLGPNKSRIIILDEAHMLSASAKSALLKPVEEPAEGTTWVFCTTEPNKIPTAIKSRCSQFELEGVSPVKIKALLEKIVNEEKFTVSNNIVNFIAMKSDKSPRRALKALELLHTESSLQKAQDLLKSIGDDEEIPAVLALGRILAKKSGSFQDALTIVRGIEGDWSSIRYGILAYFSKVCIVSRDLEQAKIALQVLHTFSKQWDPSERGAPLLLALGELLIP
jgi:DNA polymerase III subunit gamma/tau